MAKSSSPTSVRFQPEIKQRLTEEAQARHWSMSILLNEIAKQWLSIKRRQKKATAEDPPEV
jgi:predicted transcriptional regulator